MTRHCTDTRYPNEERAAAESLTGRYYLFCPLRGKWRSGKGWTNDLSKAKDCEAWEMAEAKGVHVVPADLAWGITASAVDTLAGITRSAANAVMDLSSCIGSAAIRRERVGSERVQ